MTAPLTRRSALATAAGLGVSVSFLGRAAFAASEGDLAKRKLVVVVCRGGMDGLSVSPPVGDPDYAVLRERIAIAPFGQPGGALKLDDTFGLHPALASIHDLALKGQARICPAVATPDRARSHFEAQDVLESGAAGVYGAGSGWLNRTLQAMTRGRKVEALSVGNTAPLILRGPVEAGSWSPGGLEGRDQRLPAILADLYAKDPILGPALASGLQTQSMAKTASAMAAADNGGAPGRPKPDPQAARQVGATVAKFMLEPNGPQIVAISIDNFDTHANQGTATGLLANRLTYLDGVLGGLASGLGDEWSNTVVVAATEFGRTARVNGTGGTDHGTASTALVLGGALKRTGIVGDWPTLQQARLFENRDTAPTLDMRALFKGVLSEHLGIERRALDSAIFPDSAQVAAARGVVV
jgi:uncharacterized protein (DUF1501 family)